MTVVWVGAVTGGEARVRSMFRFGILRRIRRRVQYATAFCLMPAAYPARYMTRCRPASDTRSSSQLRESMRSTP